MSGDSIAASRTHQIALSLGLAALLAGCAGDSPTTPSSDAISIGVTVPVNGALLEKGQALSISATVSYRLETASSALVGMIVQDHAGNLVPTTPLEPVTVTSGTGTASFAASTTVPHTAQRLVVYFALFADGKTVTSTVDTVQYLVRN